MAAHAQARPARTALDREPRADAARAVVHDPQTLAAFEALGIEAGLAVVGHHQLERTVLRAQLDVDAARGPVLDRVGDRLLRDPVQVRRDAALDGRHFAG